MTPNESTGRDSLTPRKDTPIEITCLGLRFGDFLRTLAARRDAGTQIESVAIPAVCARARACVCMRTKSRVAGHTVPVSPPPPAVARATHVRVSSCAHEGVAALGGATVSSRGRIPRDDPHRILLAVLRSASRIDAIVRRGPVRLLTRIRPRRRQPKTSPRDSARRLSCFRFHSNPSDRDARGHVTARWICERYSRDTSARAQNGGSAVARASDLIPRPFDG